MVEELYNIFQEQQLTIVDMYGENVTVEVLQAILKYLNKNDT